MSNKEDNEVKCVNPHYPKDVEHLIKVKLLPADFAIAQAQRDHDWNYITGRKP